MKEAAEAERFEAAAKIRDSISSMENIWKKQFIVTPHVSVDQDVIAYIGDHRGTLIETLHVRKGRVIGNRQYFLPHLNVHSETENHQDWLTSFINQYYSDNIIPDEIILPLDLGEDIYRLLGRVFQKRQGVDCRFVYVHNESHKKLMRLAENNASNHFKDQVSKKENREEALNTIQQKLRLPHFPQRIECFDVSHFQGLETVASQVVFVDGVPQTSEYRKYKIKTVQRNIDDYASMKEVLTRRFQRREIDLPDLILVDGGRGQLNIATQVLEELELSSLPVVGIAKARTERAFEKKEVLGSDERFFLPKRKNPIIFSKSSEALHVLVQLRDEAHRFAITYHRKLREQGLLASELDKVRGIGPHRKEKLLKHFGSIEALKKASVEEIARVHGVSKDLAEDLLNQLQS